VSYEEATEGRRLAIQKRRQDILEGVTPCESETERMISLLTIDDLWAEYLSALSEIHGGIQWVSLTGGVRDPVQNYFKFGGFDPFREYVKKVDLLFEELLAAIDTEIPKRLEEAGTATDVATSRRGTTWTYVTTDQPFGLAMQQAIREFVKRRTEASDV
jgi:preprotein translocase subunit SecA